MGSGNINLLVEAESNESSVDGLHGREEVGFEGGVVAGVDFVTDGNAGDAGAGKVRLDVVLDPREGFGVVGHVGNVLVADADDEFNLRVEEGAKDVWVSVVELDFADV